MKLLYQLIIKFWFILIISVGLGQTTGCMDDGYQQWSPNGGSPACNYAQFAIIEGECLYNDCLGDCQEILDNDGNWIPNSYFTDTQYDGCGECGGDGSTCSDCNGVPNGTAYINLLCINDNEDGCVGGDTGIPDCFNIDLSITTFMESNSQDTMKVFVTNLDTLKSLDIEFQYDSSILNITKFSLTGTDLLNIGYNVEDTTFIGSDNLSQVDFTLYFEPHLNTNIELFSLSGREHIFNIVLEAPLQIQADTTTQIIINELSVNEILMDDSNWEGGEISVMMHSGCTDELACNYDPYAGNDDSSCLYNDACGVCDGIETIAHNCNCTEDANDYDCYGYCTLDCPVEFSFTPGCAFIETNCNKCVGGATERYPCEQDCEAILLSTGEWGGIAYEDNCGVCISPTTETVIPGELDSLDCFNSGFKIYNSNGIEEDDFIIKELDTIYVALHMQDLPDLLEGVIIDINFEQSNLSFIDSKLNPSEFDTGLTIPNLLDSSYVLFYETSNNGVFLANIYLETTNVPSQGNNGNILFLQFSNLGINGDSTVISYNEILINEHAMKEQNYTSQVIYFGDLLSNNEYQLIPKGYHLSQNYPNPFNPITYIHYSVPNYNFINIDIMNISGQIIKKIVQSSHQPGNYEIMWDGTNHYGISVPSGIYFYKMDADEFVSVKKLVLLK